MDGNPKHAAGAGKLLVALIPSVVVRGLALALMDGESKYPRKSWRKAASKTVYLSAAWRHLLAWMDGETHAQDSGVHHLDHAMACLAILRDAEHTGSLIDDTEQAP